jgi:hypothetical protein
VLSKMPHLVCFVDICAEGKETGGYDVAAVLRCHQQRGVAILSQNFGEGILGLKINEILDAPVSNCIRTPYYPANLVDNGGEVSARGDQLESVGVASTIPLQDSKQVFSKNFPHQTASRLLHRVIHQHLGNRSHRERTTFTSG